MLVLSVALCLTGTFKELAVLGVIARFLQYIPTCIAVLVFRRRMGRGGFILPGGPLIPVVTVALCVWLMANAAPDRLLWGLGAILLGVPLYFLARLRQRATRS